MDPDEAALSRAELSDLGLHCLSRPMYPRTVDHYGNSIFDPFCEKMTLVVGASVVRAL